MPHLRLTSEQLIYFLSKGFYFLGMVMESILSFKILESILLLLQLLVNMAKDMPVPPLKLLLAFFLFYLGYDGHHLNWSRSTMPFQ